MNKESLQNEEVSTLELNEAPKKLSTEKEKSSQEFANEILLKIEKEINSEEFSQAELKRIDSSIELSNPSAKEGIKKELNLKNNLNELDNETKIAGKEAKSKIIEISEPNQEVNISKNEVLESTKKKLELSEFSKRYSSFYRSQIAQKLTQLRFQYQSKLKEKPSEIESLNLAIVKEKALMEETTENKFSNEEQQKNIQEQREKVNSEIEEIKNNLDKRKKSFIYKIQEMFIANKKGIDEEIVGLFESEGLTKSAIKNKLYQKDFEIIKTIRDNKDNLNKVNVYSEAKEKEIKEQNDYLKELKKSIEEKYKAINEAEEIMNSDYEIKEIEKTIKNFYSEMISQKNIIESETKERNVAEISKDNNVLFCHAVPMAMLPASDVSFSQNNSLVNTNKIGPEEKLKMILGIEPTLSVSTIDKEHQVLAGDFGLILKGGSVLAGYNQDAGVALGSNIYDRKSKRDSSLNTSTIQKDIASNIDNSINSKDKDGWNELVVENPKVAGLFYQINVNKLGNTFAALGTSMDYAYEISKNLNLPLYILDGKKILKLDETTKELKEVNMNDLLGSGRNISNNEKKDYIEEMIDKEAFRNKSDNIHNFNEYNSGKEYFNFIKKLNVGEKTGIEKEGESEVVKNEENQSLEFNSKYYSQVLDFISEGGDIQSYLKKMERKLEESSSNIEEIKKEGGNFSLHTKKSLLFNIYGFMEECKKSGDMENYNDAKKIIEKFGNIGECDRFVNKRVGENGKFKYLMEDAPIEVRKKIEKLSETEI